MKILMVAPRFSPKSGGGGFVVTNTLCEELVKGGHTVEVWSSDYEVDYEFVLKEYMNNPSLIPFRTISTLMSLHITPDIARFSKLIREYKNKLGFDVIHLHGCRTFQSIVVAYYARKYKIPYVVSAHGLPIQGTLLNKLISRIFDLLFTNKLVRGASICIAGTEVGVKEYLRVGAKRRNTRIIPCPYNLSIFDNLPPKGEFRRKRLLDAKQPLIGFLGGLDKIKGLDYLIKSFATLSLNSKAKSTPILVLAGTDMGFKKELEVLIKQLGIEGKVIFTGYIDGTDKLEFLVDCDVCVFPSRAESGFPYAALEATMCGVPIIVSKGTGAAEDVRKMGGGVVIDVTHPTALGEAIEIAQSGKSYFVERAQKYIRKNRSITEQVKDYEIIYKQVAG